MLTNMRSVLSALPKTSKVSESSIKLGRLLPFSQRNCDICRLGASNGLHTSVPRRRGEDRKQLAASMPKRDDGASGEKSVDIDTLIHGKVDMFPTLELPDRLFDGTPFKEIPIVNISTTKNNTQISVTDHKGVVKMFHTCGREGFKNTRKGTNIAAQATAITLTGRMIAEGYKNVRVKVRGLGPGRISAIKGLTMGGLNVISITDYTRCSEDCPRPRKQRRV